MTERAAVGAAVDLGSNSVHLLVAAITGHRLRPIVDTSAFLGLGARVDAHGALGPDGRRILAETLAGYAATARELGATTIMFIGTEPVRRAADGARIVEEVEAATGVELHVISHVEEALLTLVGVAHGRPVTHETLVLDIGGGSSEFVAVGPGNPARAAGLPLGSNRLTMRVAPSDPPTRDDVARMRALADAAMADALADQPREIVAVGGTATNLLKVTSGGTTDRVLSPARLDEAIDVLLSAPGPATAERFTLNPTRARVLPAGAVIVAALMAHYGIDRVTVSDEGVREGAVLVADHAGRGWRDRLEVLAHGWRA